MTESQGPYDGEQTNQRRDEPIPASHDDDRGGGNSPLQRVQEAQPANQEPEDTGPGQAVRDMMPSGPAPQGDVRDAPAVQVTATGDAGDDDDPEGSSGQVRITSNAVPGKPDGEVDTRRP
ncbi:MAG TPA: hypothetical protein VG268_20070 [Streptosporangiaceae bacterium]|nr:hypothetical protein [Streptosporangiaceae bacterium]